MCLKLKSFMRQSWDQTRTGRSQNPQPGPPHNTCELANPFLLQGLCSSLPLGFCIAASLPFKPLPSITSSGRPSLTFASTLSLSYHPIRLSSRHEPPLGSLLFTILLWLSPSTRTRGLWEQGPISVLLAPGTHSLVLSLPHEGSHKLLSSWVTATGWLVVCSRRWHLLGQSLEKHLVYDWCMSPDWLSSTSVSLPLCHFRQENWCILWFGVQL